MRRAAAVLVIALLSGTFLAGCGAYVVSPVTGFAFTDVKGPVDTTGNTAYSLKVGTAKCESYLGLVAVGDASIKTAMEDGGITKVHHVDFHSVSYLGIYAKFVVTVYGE